MPNVIGCSNGEGKQWKVLPIQSAKQVGGAIVADSDPLAEYQETLVKAAALLDTVGSQIV